MSVENTGTSVFESKINEILSLDPRLVLLTIVQGPDAFNFASVYKKDGSGARVDLDATPLGIYKQVLEQNNVTVQVSILF